jgi:hypothetical protein
MMDNEEVINLFYTSFKNRDFATMQACYADNATFSDEAFVNLDAHQTRAMWEMLIRRGKDIQITFGDIVIRGNKGTAKWEAIYTFSATKRMVHNKIKAEFVFENGKIVKHRDSFSLFRWAQQVYGFMGWVVGWTPFFRMKLQKTAKKSLDEFMKKNYLTGTM